METWQRQIINNNLSFLVQNVNVTTTLLAKLEERNLFSTYNVQIVDAARTQIEKSGKLFDILVTRSSAFDIFIEVLMDIDVKQYAPANLLFEERSKHYKQRGSLGPTMRFSVIPDSAALLESQVVAASPTSEALLAIEFSVGSTAL